MTRSTSALLTILLLFGCSTPREGDTLDLAVQWNLETNFAEGGGHRARFSIHNNSGIALTANNWEMYWNMAPRTVKAESITAPVTIEWINGDFYVMKPQAGFHLGPGEAIDIEYGGEGPVIKETDAPLGLYAVLYGDDGSPSLHPILAYTIEPFVGPDQINRSAQDAEPIPTPEWLYDDQAGVSQLPDDQVPLFVPRPRNVTMADGHFAIGAGVALTYESGLGSEANLLAAFLDDLLQAPIPVEEAAAAPSGAIQLQLRDVSIPGSYDLSISPTDGVIIAGDQSGVFYGAQSLKALVPAASLGEENDSIAIPALRISDSPAFQYRGMHLDVARNFHSVETVKRLLDVMAFYKLNKLHLHLTEDEGWRIEIAALPALTRVGAFRGHPTDAGDHLQPSYGSGPFADASTGYGSGFYSREQYMDLLKYAWERHIEVIPEINVPGHSRAAIKAMEYRYRHLMDEGREADAEQYRLVDPEETSEYRSAQWYTDNVINVCRESAFTFVTTVIDAIIEMHEDAGVPLTMIHTGGDEVPRGAWSESPLCDDYLANHPEIDNPRNLQKAFFRRIREYINAKGIRTAGWEEIAMDFREDGSWAPNDEFADTTVVPYIWNSLYGAEDLGYRLANAGYPIVLANVTNFYFDLAYNKDPREPGLYWGGFVNTRDAFDFVPYDVFRSFTVKPNGDPYTDDDFAGKEILTTAGHRNVLGLQGELWSETLKGPDMLEYYYLPKMLGLAERAWYGQAVWGGITNREVRNAAVDAAWNVFANTLGQREFPRLDRLYGGYNYRLAPPGARVENGILMVNTAYPDLTVRYTTNGSDPTPESRQYTQPVEVPAGTIKLSTFDSRGRSSLPTVVEWR